MNATLASERPSIIGAMERVPFSRYVVFSAIAVIGCALDLVTKAWVFSSPVLRSGQILWLWDGHVGIQLSRNWGALFGIGQGKTWLFASLSVFALIAIPIWLFAFRAARDGWLTFTLGCVTAGILGNLYDRLGLSGQQWAAPGHTSPDAVHAVRDWILWQANDRWRWPNFNIADSLLVLGACLMFLQFRRVTAAHDPLSDREAIR
jgi:signal peptidase II